jgi:plasmid stabilization system protein ParE
LRELVTSYNYLIRYQVTGDVVEIVRVRHTSRRPTTP